MNDLAIIVPVLRRRQNVTPLLISILAATPGAHVVFVADPDDDPEIAAIKDAQDRYDTLKRDLTISLLTCAGNYAEKIGLAVQVCDEPLIFLGADDLDFYAGWLDAAVSTMDGGAQVVGVNDLLPRRRHHATHFLMTREYALRPTIDGLAGPLYSGYGHNFVDDELIATATKRGVYAYADNARVQHLHPQGRTAPDDPTYQKGRESFHDDRRIFNSRSVLWT